MAVIAGGALGALAVVEVVLRTDGPGTRLSTALLLALGATVPVAVVKAGTGAGGGVVAGMGAAPGVPEIPPRDRLAATVIVTANVVTVLAYREPTVTGVAALLLVAYLLGRDHLRRRRVEAAARAASRRTVEETLLEHAARGERARIARELHDVVAHHISLIAVQAETTRLAVPGMPAEGAERLLAIGDTARTALTEMRRLLGVLREDTEDLTGRRPQPGLQQLNELVDQARGAAGGTVRLIVRGQVGPLDPGVELAAYRIVQEALTNARRHAPRAAVDVELTYAPGALLVRIRDNGPGPAGATHSRRGLGDRRRGGHGLLGMRERAAAVGGDLAAGPASVGGFLVEATLPAPRPTSTGVAG